MMSIEEKRQLGQSLSQLSPEDITKALQIIAQKNPSFKATGDEVELDIDAQVFAYFVCHPYPGLVIIEQDASTLWRLQYFVKAVLGLQTRNSNAKTQAKTKRNREICDAIVKNARKRSRKMLS